VSAGFTVEIGQRQEEIRGLEAKVSRQSEEVCKLREQVDGETLVSPIALLLGICSWLSDAVGVWLG
jgi:hypothetical protein